MKILKAQSAILTNFELSRFLKNQSDRYASETPKRRAPGNMHSLVNEVQAYLRTFPNPLHESPPEEDPKAKLTKENNDLSLPVAVPVVSYSPYETYSDETIQGLAQRLTPYGITKSELMTIFNLRPENMAIFLSIVEDADSRWSAERQKEMLDIITDTLGRFPDELRAYHIANKNEEAAAAAAATATTITEKQEKDAIEP